MRVLISGASVAGLALAYWLQEYGFEVTTVEQGSGLRRGGYGVDIRGAAIEVCRRMEILEAVRAADTNMQGVLFVNKKGKVEAKVGEAAMGNEPGVDIEIMRDDLTNILYERTKDKVSYIWGDSISTLRETDAGIEVAFVKAPGQVFDIAIGADGMHSKTRTLTFGPETQFVYPLGSYISIFTLDNYLNLAHQEKFYTTPGKTVGYYPTRNNSEAKAMFLFQSQPLTYSYKDIEAQKKLVADTFAKEAGWETQKLLRSMQTATDFYFDSVSQIIMPAWSKGRVGLVGDAAYCPSPLSGQGSSLALVGAYVLAGELKEAQGNYSLAFSTYEQQMRSFVEQNQKIGKMVAGSMVENSQFKIHLRNFMMRLPGVMPIMFRYINKMVAKSANAIVLKDYQTSSKQQVGVA